MRTTQGAGGVMVSTVVELTVSGTAGDTGLEGTLFGLLDLETDRKLMSDVQDTLVSMLQAMAGDNLTRWLMLIKDVLQASTGTGRACVCVCVWRVCVLRNCVCVVRACV